MADLKCQSIKLHSFCFETSKGIKKINETICFSNLQRQTQNYDYLHAITLLYLNSFEEFIHFIKNVFRVQVFDTDFTKGQMLVVITNIFYLSSS